MECFGNVGKKQVNAVDLSTVLSEGRQLGVGLKGLINLVELGGRLCEIKYGLYGLKINECLQ